MSHEPDITETKPSKNYTNMKIDIPYSTFIGGGAQFNGNWFVEIFRTPIYYLTLFTYRLFNIFNSSKKITSNHYNNNNNILFITRDWGTNTTLNFGISTSLHEYCGQNNIKTLEILKYDNIVKEITNTLEKDSYSHVILDTRVMLTENGFINIIHSLYYCCSLANLFIKKGCICLCGVTDVHQPGFRLQAELLTSNNGLIISWSGADNNHSLYRHRRVVGPLFTPLSQEFITNFYSTNDDDIPKSDIAFLGNWLSYEPRKSFTNEIIPWLKKNNINTYFNSRKNIAYVSYLDIYRNSKIGINTNWVANQPNKYHFVGRNFEILLSGSLLLTNKSPGLDLYLNEGEDYVLFDSLEDIKEKIKYYLSHEDHRKKIALSGQNKVLELHKKMFVWNEINKALRIHHLPEVPQDKKT